MSILKFFGFMLIVCLIAACSPPATPEAIAAPTTAATADATPTRPSMMGQLAPTTDAAATPDPKTAIVAVVRFFYTNLFQAKDVSPYVCKTADVETLKTTHLHGFESSSDAVVNLDSVIFGTYEDFEGTISGSVDGTVKVTVGGTETTVDVDIYKIPMAEEDGSWKVCG